MNPHTDLEAWRLLWQAEPKRPLAEELRARVARETRLRTLTLMTAVLITVVIGGWTLARAAASGAFEDVVLAVNTWLFSAGVWTMALWTDRGTWRPLGNTTAAFLDLSIRRCRSSLTALRLALLLYPVQLAAVTSWKLSFSDTDAMTLLASWPFVILGWLGMPAMVAFYAWFSTRKRAELARLVDLREQVGRD